MKTLFSTSLAILAFITLVSIPTGQGETIFNDWRWVDVRHLDLGSHLDHSDLEDEQAQRDLFDAWKAKHGIRFKDEKEERKAFKVMMENSKEIQKHRDDYRKGYHSYNRGLNKFSHMTLEEFKSKNLGFKKDHSRTHSTRGYISTTRTRQVNFPSSLNWTAKGYVTPVKNQGSCGSCWSFSTTGVLEGAHFRKTGQLIALSEQNLVECVPGYVGCGGGLPSGAVKYIKSKGGVATESSYPYASGSGAYSACGKSNVNTVSMSPSIVTTRPDDVSLQTALVTYGPVSVAVAVGSGFYSYESGVMDPHTACGTSIDHAVLLTGYGTDSATGLKYWIVKNSWGQDWGEHGYFRLRRDIQDSCRITEEYTAVTI